MRSAKCGIEKTEHDNRTSHSTLRTPHLRGFTLIEVLLAVAILAVIMTVVYGSFSTASKNIEQAEESRAATDLARTLMLRLSDDIANAYVNTAMNNPKVITIFMGKKDELSDDIGDRKIRHDSLDLTTLTNWRRPDTKESELWEVGYFFKEKPDGQGYSLFRKEKRILSKDSPAGEGGDEYELTDRVASLQFRYWNNGQWADDWSLGTPQAVEITLVLDTGQVYVTQVDIVYRPS